LYDRVDRKRSLKEEERKQLKEERTKGSEEKQ